MKINKLILKNFSAIKNALNANEIEIDFSESQNKICLLIGPNGSGKTSILSQLHPFSDVGNLDVRNGNKLILEGKDGYKELTIIKDGHEFIIKHFYSPQKDKNHSVKSYIIKDKVDLNINGNVTSFKEIVKEELQIEPDYLKLIRLGSNVTSMIDLTSTERKNFMSKIMDDIGIYLEYYKSINQKIRQLDELMSHTIDKMKRLEISEESVEEESISSMKVMLSKIEDEYISTSSKILKLNEFIESFGDMGEFYSNGNKLINRYEKMIKILSKKDEIKFDSSYYENIINKLQLKINTLENEYDSNNILVQKSVSHLDLLHQELRSYSIQMQKEQNTDREIELINENLEKINFKLRELEGNLKDFEVSFAKADFDAFYNFIINIQKILSRTYDFGKKPIEKVIELLENEQNVMHYINSHLIDIDEKKDKNNSVFINSIFNRLIFHPNEDIVINCKNECIAKDLFNQMKTLVDSKEVNDDNEDESFYRDMELTYSNIKAIIPQFKEYKDIIEKLPDDIKEDFLLKNIYKKIKKLSYIYNEKKLNDLKSKMAEYDTYNNLLLNYKEQSDNLKKFVSLSNSKMIKEQMSLIENSITEENDSIVKLKNRNIDIKEELKELSMTLEYNKDIKETIEEFEEVKASYEKYIKDKEDVLRTNKELKELNDKQYEIVKDRNTLNEDIQKAISNLDQFKTLKKDYSKYYKVYDDLSLLKDAFSSKTGIPLRIISSYLDNTNEITNEFLDIAYEGRIYIDNFNITANEFSIPFFINGIRMDDVKYASQGELSFLSIALSFALSSQVLSKYNIMLLDEIDGPLDINNREKFIKILEAQIDKIDSEQSFLITHNAMFNQYPVDIIDLSFKNKSEDFSLSNFITIKRK